MLDLIQEAIGNIRQEAIREPDHVLREGEIYGSWIRRSGEIWCIDGEGFVPRFAVHVEKRRGRSIGIPDFDNARGGMTYDVLGTSYGSRN